MLSNIGLEPSRPPSCAIMSPRLLTASVKRHGLLELVYIISSIPYPEGAFPAVGAVAGGRQRDSACGIRGEIQMMCLDLLKSYTQRDDEFRPAIPRSGCSPALPVCASPARIS